MYTQPDTLLAICHRLSPGDNIRLLHGLKARIRNQPLLKKIIIFSPKSVLDRTKQLCEKTISGVSTKWIKLNCEDNEIRAVLSELNSKRHLKQFNTAPLFWTSYSVSRDYLTKERLVGNYIADILRIDQQEFGFYDKTWEWKRPLRSQKHSSNKKLSALFFVRNDCKVDTFRNSPKYHLEIINWLKKSCKVTIAGLEDRKAYSDADWDIDGVNFHGFKNNSFYDQVREFSRHHFAAGINCSALDLASIAGIPVIRDCEFQGLGGRYFGGSKFNSFLAVKLNVGLAPQKNPTDTWFNAPHLPHRFESTIETVIGLLKNKRKLIDKPDHLLLSYPFYLKNSKDPNSLAVYAST
ncbi:MAG: hypothetical protein HY291_13520 [Planctomycetes bacterium]|nr:hypothetical protein [Planctomycetota bacterium]